MKRTVALESDKYAWLKDFNGFVATTWNHNNLHWSLIVVDPEGVIHWVDSLKKKYIPEQMDDTSLYVIHTII